MHRRNSRGDCVLEPATERMTRLPATPGERYHRGSLRRDPVPITGAQEAAYRCATTRYDHVRLRNPMTQAPTTNAASEKPNKSGKAREWMPMFWDGMNFPAWMRLLTKNRFRLGWQWWYMLPIVTAFSLFHSVDRVWQ